MLATFIIALREYLEVFLIIGVFAGIINKTDGKRLKEVGLASLLGIAVSLLLPLGLFFLEKYLGLSFTEEKADFYEGVLMLFSGIFIVYVVTSLHALMSGGKSALISRTRDNVGGDAVFDFSLFLTLAFLIIKEGFEISLFTLSSSLLVLLRDNITGLLLGFAASAAVALGAAYVYGRIPVKKIYRLTEYFIIFIGANFVTAGLGEILDQFFNFRLSAVVPLGLRMLPDESTFAGHLLANLFGISRAMSLGQVAVMISYILLAVFLLKKRVPEKTYR